MLMPFGKSMWICQFTEQKISENDKLLFFKVYHAFLIATKIKIIEQSVYTFILIFKEISFLGSSVIVASCGYGLSFYFLELLLSKCASNFCDLYSVCILLQLSI